MTKQVRVRDVLIGGGAPITIQSMTNTDTRDIDATVKQIRALEDAGVEIVRLAVYDEDCARAIKAIKKRVSVPLVADIHFDYRLALLSLESGIDKLRFNPGNIGSSENVLKLVHAAKDKQVPIRIGVNGGSLEKDILHAYGGPTAEALVESALSHVKILEDAHFYDIVLSMKSSNVPTTVKAYALAAKKTDYPLHIGVTEAGLGEDGIVKSSIGLGALLLNGIGDTLRVSLTGDPCAEVHAARSILQSSGARFFGGVEVVSCPTCGRCGADLASIVERVKSSIPKIDKHVRIAVMGCAVNGPGEAKEADAGLACGKNGRAVVFANGEQKGGMPFDEAIRFLCDYVVEL